MNMKEVDLLPCNNTRLGYGSGKWRIVELSTTSMPNINQLTNKLYFTQLIIVPAIKYATCFLNYPC